MVNQIMVNGDLEGLQYRIKAYLFFDSLKSFFFKVIDQLSFILRMKRIYNLICEAHKTINGVNRIPEPGMESGNTFAERGAVFLSDQLTCLEAGLVIQF